VGVEGLVDIGDWLHVSRVGKSSIKYTDQCNSNMPYYEAPRKLRSRGINILQTNATALDFSKRAFCHTSPTVWNSLPQSVISDL